VDVAFTLGPAQVAWWELSRDDRYIWDHLIEHLLEARRPGDAEATACDLRWVDARLEQFGPIAPVTDLTKIGGLRAAHLRTALARVAHLLSPTDPAEAVVDVLHSRIADVPGWARQVLAMRDTYSRARLVNLWPLPDVPAPALRRVVRVRPGWTIAMAVAMGPQGDWLTTGSSDGIVRIWDVVTGQERATLNGHRGPPATYVERTATVTSVAVVTNGSWIASGSDDKTVRIWDVKTGQARAVLEGHSGTVRAVAVSPDGSWIASGSDDGSVRVWDMRTCQEQAALKGHNDQFDFRPVWTDGGRPVSAWRRIWGFRRPEPWPDLRITMKSLRITMKRRSAMVWAVAVAPDGSWIASGSDDKTVRIWDVKTSQTRAVLEGHSGAVRAVAVAPDSNWMASGSDDGTVRIWNMGTRQEWATVKGDADRVVAVAVAPDGSWIASGSGDKTVRIWDTRTGQARAVLEGHSGAVLAVAVAPDGSWIASGSGDKTVRIWDTRTGQARAVLEGHSGAVLAVAVAPDGSWIASGSIDRTVRIWDAKTGQARVIFEDHILMVEAMAVSPDGSWIASGGEDKTVKIWDVGTTEIRTVLEGHTQGVKALAVSPDGSWLASGSDDKTVRIWDVETGRVLAMMRLEGSVGACACLDTHRLAIGGSAGMYLFDFLPGTNPSGTNR
jgi:WD40 repeat protein